MQNETLDARIIETEEAVEAARAKIDEVAKHGTNQELDEAVRVWRAAWRRLERYVRWQAEREPAV